MNSQKSIQALTLSALLAALVPAYALADDASIKSQVQAELKMHPALQAPNSIRVQTRNQVVYLYGHVDTELQREEAVSIAEGVSNVKRVVATIRTTYAGG